MALAARTALISLTAALALAAPAGAALVPQPDLPSLTPAGARQLWVSPHGSDRAAGTRTHPLKTVTAAWRRIPDDRPLTRGVIVNVTPGRYRARSLPNYWERKRGTAAAPIVVRATKPNAVTFSSVNIANVSWLAFDAIRFRDRFDLFHCEGCAHLLLNHLDLTGSPKQLHETVKVNQSTHVGILGSTVRGADDNAIDFVAVQYALVKGNRVGDAGDWCEYAKGGSAFVTVTGNDFSDCGTGGFTAGQGTGFQFMVAPYITYEAMGVAVLDNTFRRLQGAAVGVNGGYDVVVAGNRAYDVGQRSHWLEVTYGLRSCDGQPGDEGRQRCAQNLAAGGWGTTRVDDGTNEVHVPNRHLYFLGNAIDQPRRQGDQLLSVADPFDEAGSQSGSGLGRVRADDDLTLAGNVLAGRGLPTGTEECGGCGDVAASNQVDAAPGLFRDPEHGDLRFAPGREVAPASLPVLGWEDAPLGVRPG